MNNLYPTRSSAVNCRQLRLFARVRPSLDWNGSPLDESHSIRCSSSEILISPPQDDSSSLARHSSHTSKSFIFDRVFDPESMQSHIHQEISKPCISNVLDYNLSSVILLFGQTGAGKSYTAFGGSQPSQLGLIPRTIYDLFEEIVNRKNKVDISVRYVQLYQDKWIDLLSTEATTIRDGTDSSEILVEDVDQVLTLLKYGENRKVIAATRLNSDSSRGHTFFQITIHGEMDRSITFVDLAGSERVNTSGQLAKSMISKTRDPRLLAQMEARVLTEAQSINKSLHALHVCITRLAQSLVSAGNQQDSLKTLNKGMNGRSLRSPSPVLLSQPSNARKPSPLDLASQQQSNQHIPWRSSRLTQMIYRCLQGNAALSLLVCVAPEERNYRESLSTLYFASHARAAAAAASGALKDARRLLVDPISALRKEQELRKDNEEMKQKMKEATRRQIGRNNGVEFMKALESGRFLSRRNANNVRVSRMSLSRISTEINASHRTPSHPSDFHKTKMQPPLLSSEDRKSRELSPSKDLHHILSRIRADPINCRHDPAVQQMIDRLKTLNLPENLILKLPQEVQELLHPSPFDDDFSDSGMEAESNYSGTESEAPYSGIAKTLKPNSSIDLAFVNSTLPDRSFSNNTESPDLVARLEQQESRIKALEALALSTPLQEIPSSVEFGHLRALPLSVPKLSLHVSTASNRPPLSPAPKTPRRSLSSPGFQSHRVENSPDRSTYEEENKIREQGDSILQLLLSPASSKTVSVLEKALQSGDPVALLQSVAAIAVPSPTLAKSQGTDGVTTSMEGLKTLQTLAAIPILSSQVKQLEEIKKTEGKIEVEEIAIPNGLVVETHLPSSDSPDLVVKDNRTDADVYDSTQRLLQLANETTMLEQSVLKPTEPIDAIVTNISNASDTVLSAVSTPHNSKYTRKEEERSTEGATTAFDREKSFLELLEAALRQSDNVLEEQLNLSINMNRSGLRATSNVDTLSSKEKSMSSYEDSCVNNNNVIPADFASISKEEITISTPSKHNTIMLHETISNQMSLHKAQHTPDGVDQSLLLSPITPLTPVGKQPIVQLATSEKFAKDTRRVDRVEAGNATPIRSLLNSEQLSESSARNRRADRESTIWSLQKKQAEKEKSPEFEYKSKELNDNSLPEMAVSSPESIADSLSYSPWMMMQHQLKADDGSLHASELERSESEFRGSANSALQSIDSRSNKGHRAKSNHSRRSRGYYRERHDDESVSVDSSFDDTEDKRKWKKSESDDTSSRTSDDSLKKSRRRRSRTGYGRKTRTKRVSDSSHLLNESVASIITSISGLLGQITSQTNGLNTNKAKEIVKATKSKSRGNSVRNIPTSHYQPIKKEKLSPHPPPPVHAIPEKIVLPNGSELMNNVSELAEVQVNPLFQTIYNMAMKDLKKHEYSAVSSRKSPGQLKRSQQIQKETEKVTLPSKFFDSTAMELVAEEDTAQRIAHASVAAERLAAKKRKDFVKAGKKGLDPSVSISSNNNYDEGGCREFESAYDEMDDSFLASSRLNHSISLRTPESGENGEIAVEDTLLRTITASNFEKTGSDHRIRILPRSQLSASSQMRTPASTTRDASQMSPYRSISKKLAFHSNISGIDQHSPLFSSAPATPISQVKKQGKPGRPGPSPLRSNSKSVSKSATMTNVDGYSSTAQNGSISLTTVRINPRINNSFANADANENNTSKVSDSKKLHRNVLMSPVSNGNESLLSDQSFNNSVSSSSSSSINFESDDDDRVPRRPARLSSPASYEKLVKVDWPGLGVVELVPSAVPTFAKVLHEKKTSPKKIERNRATDSRAATADKQMSNSKSIVDDTLVTNETGVSAMQTVNLRARAAKGSEAESSKPQTNELNNDQVKLKIGKSSNVSSNQSPKEAPLVDLERSISDIDKNIAAVGAVTSAKSSFNEAKLLLNDPLIQSLLNTPRNKVARLETPKFTSNYNTNLSHQNSAPLSSAPTPVGVKYLNNSNNDGDKRKSPASISKNTIQLPPNHYTYSPNQGGSKSVTPIQTTFLNQFKNNSERIEHQKAIELLWKHRHDTENAENEDINKKKVMGQFVNTMTLKQSTKNMNSIQTQSHENNLPLSINIDFHSLRTPPPPPTSSRKKNKSVY